ncbi:hypothetical protein NW762_003188 [Fusarium torreyae]|uniref:Uncharacterized protein n=1 Tax=Fusarium torreyae TaxID=1237075 RepID=A0A9W8SAA1_9HYPO|nr:hypothetical protein NW762_003188 [Fusarium torreyae]
MSQHIVQGSAEHVSSLLSGYGLGCPHYMVCSSADSQTQCYPKRLAFFSSHNPDLVIFYIDTKNICSDCLKLFVPSGFNFWSLLPDPNGEGANAESPPRRWLSSNEQAEHFINLRRIGGVASDPAIVPLPSSPSGTSAWEWIKSQRKPFYIDQLHLAPKWSPISERNALADSSTAWKYGIPVPAPTIKETSAPRDNKVQNDKMTGAKASVSNSIKDSSSKSKNRASVVDKPKKKKPREPEIPGDIADEQVARPNPENKVERVLKAENDGKQVGQKRPSLKEQANSSQKEKGVPSKNENVKFETTLPPQGLSKPLKAQTPSKMPPLAVPQSTLSPMQDPKPPVEQDMPNLASVTAPLTPPSPPVRRKPVGTSRKTSNAVDGQVNNTELDIRTDSHAIGRGKEPAPDPVSSLPSILSPKHEAAEPETTSLSKKRKASSKSKNTSTTEEVPTDPKAAEPLEKPSKKKSSKVKPVGTTKDMSILPSEELPKKKSSQATSVLTYTRSWYNHDPLSFDGAMILSKLSDYKRRAGTANTYASKTPQLPVESLLQEKKPLDKEKMLSSLKDEKPQKKNDPLMAFYAPDGKDRKLPKLPLGSASGMKFRLEAESSRVSSKGKATSLGKLPKQNTTVPSSTGLGKISKTTSAEPAKTKDKLPKVTKQEKDARSQPGTKTGSAGIHSKHSTSEVNRKSQTTIVNHENLQYEQSKKKLHGHRADKKPQHKPNKKPASKPHTHKPHGHGHQHDGHKPHDHDPHSQGHTSDEHHDDSDGHPGEQHPGAGPTDGTAQAPPQPTTHPVDDSSVPSSPVESNTPENEIVDTVHGAPQPGSPAQELPTSPIDSEAPDRPPSAENTVGEQNQAGPQPIGTIPQASGTGNTQENVPENESSPVQPTSESPAGNVNCSNEYAATAATIVPALDNSPSGTEPDLKHADGNSMEPSSTTPAREAQPATVSSADNATSLSTSAATTDTAAPTAVAFAPSPQAISNDVSGNRRIPTSTTATEESQAAIVAGSGSAQEYQGQFTQQPAQGVRYQADYVSDPRGGLDIPGQPPLGGKGPSASSSKLSAAAIGILVGASIVGGAASADHLSASDENSIPAASDLDGVASRDSEEGPAEGWDNEHDEFDDSFGAHQHPEHDDIDIQSFHSNDSLPSSYEYGASGHVAEDDNASQQGDSRNDGEVHGHSSSTSDSGDGPHGHQHENLDTSDNELLHQATEAWSHGTSSDDQDHKAEEDDEDDFQPHGSENQYGSFHNSSDSDSENVLFTKEDEVEYDNDDPQDDVSLENRSDGSSNHSAELEELGQDEDKDSSSREPSSESDDGELDQGFNSGSEKSMQDDTDDPDAGLSQGDSAQESDNDTGQDSDHSVEHDSEQNSEDEQESVSESSASSEDHGEDSTNERESDEGAEDEQSDPESDPEPSYSEQEPESPSEAEQESYSDGGGDGDSYSSD